MELSNNKIFQILLSATVNLISILGFLTFRFSWQQAWLCQGLKQKNFQINEDPVKGSVGIFWKPFFINPSRRLKIRSGCFESEADLMLCMTGKFHFFFDSDKLKSSFSKERPHSVRSDCKDFLTRGRARFQVLCAEPSRPVSR